MTAANVCDELWVEEKFQSNRVIAGSRRNSFRASLEVERNGGRALKYCRGSNPICVQQTPNSIVAYSGVRKRDLSSVLKRERAQTVV